MTSLTLSSGSCTYTLSHTEETFASSGGVGSVSVTAPNGCSWTAESHNDWVTITSGENSSGNGTLYYSVSSHVSTGYRTGTLTIAGKLFTVTQGLSNRPSASTNVHSTSHSIGVASEDSTIDIVWTASVDADGDLLGYAVIWDQSTSVMLQTELDISIKSVSIKPNKRRCPLWLNKEDIFLLKTKLKS